MKTRTITYQQAQRLVDSFYGVYSKYDKLIFRELLFVGIVFKKESIPIPEEFYNNLRSTNHNEALLDEIFGIECKFKEGDVIWNEEYGVTTNSV